MRAPLYSEHAAEILEPDVIEDPHPLFARLRSERPISRIGETGVHLVATWDTIEEVLSREDDFSANLTGVLVSGEDGLPAVLELPMTQANQVIATADEPRHSVHRRLVQPRMTAKRIGQLEERVRLWVRTALDSWFQGGAGDFVPISETVPARAVAAVLGLPDADLERHRAWAMMGGEMLAGNVAPAQMAALRAETGRMARYLAEQLGVAPRSSQTESEACLLGILNQGVEANEIDLGEAIGIAIVLFGAGGESTSALIGSSMRLLAADPELRAQLRSSPDSIPRFVEETLRLEPPFKFHYRSVRRSCELGGYLLGPGDRLMLLWASANRDASHFDAPDEIRLDRAHPRQHMSLGRGSHFCPGAHLARLEARILVEEVLSRENDIGLDPDDPPRHASTIFVRRLERLPILATALPRADPVSS